MNVKILDKTFLIEKGTNPAKVELKIRDDIRKRIGLLAKDLDIHLVKNLIIIPNDNAKALAEVKPYLYNDEPCLDICLQHVAIGCWLKGIKTDDFEEVIFHELCHCDDIAKTVGHSGTKNFIELDSAIQSVMQLYEHIGILMWGEYAAYYMTYERYLCRHNPFESKFSDAIRNAKVALEFIKNNRDKDAGLVYETTRRYLRDLFYAVTKNIASISAQKNEHLNQKNDELLVAGEIHVTGLKAFSYKVREQLFYMKSIEYKDGFSSCFYELGEIFYSLYVDNGIQPIDNNGALEFAYT